MTFRDWINSPEGKKTRAEIHDWVLEYNKKCFVPKDSGEIPSRLGEGIVVPKAPVGSGPEDCRKEEGDHQ
jgi:hypothetical protein